MSRTPALTRALSLPIWQGPVTAEPLGGGITNVNFVVTDARRRAVVRIGDDIPVHQVMRFNELAAARAAHAAGISPAVLYHEPGALVIDYIEARTLSAEDVRAPGMLDRILPLVARAHREIPRHLRGPALMFWVFHVIRDYAATLKDGDSRHSPRLPEVLRVAERLEAAVGPIDLIFGHNDLLPANLLDDGNRLWLIDWDYAGFNSPLFDLGGLAANNGLSPAQETAMLEAYFDRAPDAGLWRRYRAMKCASALRETLWSMVSELYSELDFDFAAYTETNLAAYRAALDAFEET
ncbi:choline kinase [Rhodobacter veldkampii DSM 11550]|uniref:Choline kinase n=1 Tax=Phaeovulum veldkampii DSM 11550 TaxID=1185920 RepID=A0A2T4JIB6_9RHOB|nr:choline kinase family protein [Phaeovulum veldkampii]MBK5947186.1 choline kinase [Phaeovulum veldkampii DSM 11550]NCU19432.1 choline kinase [Candidatus Falkowbacteria bacterium]PTE17644.1 choline kinase [Phaeovulum veldkampii DSM 11550]TDQ57527.1 thiamine kinase-like enzyme [Phaeovulum veldkampii DSM 11550]